MFQNCTDVLEDFYAREKKKKAEAKSRLSLNRRLSAGASSSKDTTPSPAKQSKQQQTAVSGWRRQPPARATTTKKASNAGPSKKKSSKRAVIQDDSSSNSAGESAFSTHSRDPSPIKLPRTSTVTNTHTTSSNGGTYAQHPTKGYELEPLDDGSFDPHGAVTIIKPCGGDDGFERGWKVQMLLGVRMRPSVAGLGGEEPWIIVKFHRYLHCQLLPLWKVEEHEAEVSGLLG